MGTSWWQARPGRLLQEEQALLALYDDETPVIAKHWWRRDETDGIVLRVTLAPLPVELEVRFPPHYPDECPNARPKNAAGTFSSHQFVTSKILCLELGPDNWHPRHTVADIVRSAQKLIHAELKNLETRTVDIPSRHQPSAGERVRGRSSMVLLRTKGFGDALAALQENAEFEYVFSFRGLDRIVPVAMPKGEALTDKIPAFRHERSTMTGIVACLSDSADEKVPTDPDEFKAFVEKHGGGALGETLCVVLKWSDGVTRAYIAGEKKVVELEDMPVVQELGGRVDDDLRVRLGELRFGIVGLGSLGSKDAVSLARTGARSFLLVDSDVLVGPNICRHAADFRDLGAYKVDSVEHMIKDVLLDEVDVETRCMEIASATNPEAHAKVLGELAECDVLIDATASPEVFCLLAMLASDHARPLAWAEVFGGGLGGMVASAVPEETPCPRCVRDGFNHETQAWPKRPGGDSTAPYEGGEDEPFVATDADVSTIAAGLTGRVLTIVRGDGMELPAVQLVGLRRGWIFEDAMQTIPVSVRSDDWSCPRCWTPTADPDPEAAAKAAALITDKADAKDPSGA